MPPLDALRRRTFALHAKLSTLRDEVKEWCTLAKTKDFAIHQSQIEHVSGGLTSMHGVIEADLVAREKAATLTLADVSDFERQLLAARQVWESYRSKFALRLVKQMREDLSILDELAWNAYRNARDRAVQSKQVSALQVKEPPLVFPNGHWSPFARSREDAFELDEASGNESALDGFDSILQSLPVPLVGIPWYQVAHLPEAVFIGHEVGHLVENDFDLGWQLQSALDLELPKEGVDAVPEERRKAWMDHWRSEVFADVYGVLTTGPAYAAIMVDLLSGDAARIATEVQPDPTRSGRQQWSGYPTRALRARLVCEAVGQLDGDKESPEIFRNPAAALRAAWDQAFPAHAMQPYEADVPRVVRALLRTPLPAFAISAAPNGCPLVDVMIFSATMEREAQRAASKANSKSEIKSADLRVLFAGVAQAFLSDPERYQKSGAQDRFRRRIVEKRSIAPRTIAAPGFKAATVQDRTAWSGSALAERIRAVTAADKKPNPVDYMFGPKV